MRNGLVLGVVAGMAAGVAASVYALNCIRPDVTGRMCRNGRKVVQRWKRQMML